MPSFQNGGGDRYLEEIPVNAQKFARRVKKNVEDWNFDGVDFFNLVREKGTQREAGCNQLACISGPKMDIQEHTQIESLSHHPALI